MSARQRIATALAALMLACGTATAARAVEVDLELVLTVDVSLSMDFEEQAIQRAGYVRALRHPDVIDAIGRGLLGRIAVTYVEWAGTAHQAVILPWTLIDGPASASAFAARLEAAPQTRARRTSISAALLHAAELFEGNGYEGLRRVIDVSGDGPNNQGLGVHDARDLVLAGGLVINGLPLMLKVPNGSFFEMPFLDEYYRACVIGGPGSFIVPVRSPVEFPAAIRRKMIQEIAAAAPAPQFAQATVPEEPVMDCLIGEKLWQRWMRDME